MTLKMTVGDKVCLTAALALMTGGPFLVDVIMPPAHAEAPATVQVQVVDRPVPSGSAAELWSAETEWPEPDYNIPLDKPLAEVLAECCEEYNAPLELALGVMEVESGFDPYSVGPDGHDFGLFQIRDSNHAWLIEETGADPMTPEGNIRCGVWMLSYLLDRYGDQSAALTAYRYGHDNGSRTYANAVLAAAERWAEVCTEQEGL